MCYGRTTQGTGWSHLAVFIPDPIQLSCAIGPGRVKCERVPSRAAGSQPAPPALWSGGVSGSEEGMLGPLQLPWARTRHCVAEMLEQVVRPTADMADIDLVLGKLAGFELILCASSSLVSLGTCYLGSSAVQSVWAPAVLLCALLPCIKESQWFAVPDLSAGMKHELRLKCENTTSAIETNCSWHLGKDTFLVSCANVLIAPVHSAA